jgi:hypothetical protein
MASAAIGWAGQPPPGYCPLFRLPLCSCGYWRKSNGLWAAVWPGVRGRPLDAEPGADAGPAAPQALLYGQIRPRSICALLCPLQAIHAACAAAATNALVRSAPRTQNRTLSTRSHLC